MIVAILRHHIATGWLDPGDVQKTTYGGAAEALDSQAGL
jgi:hypothetical protein